MALRYKVRFGNYEAYTAALATEGTNSLIRVNNNNRFFLSVEEPSSLNELSLDAAPVDKQLNDFEKHYDATISEDFQYDLDLQIPAIFDMANFTLDDPNNSSLDDVLVLIEANKAWASSTGKNVAIAVVDTGIDGTRPEFPESKRVGSWQPIGDVPWTDWQGHGTMCACIAAGTKSAGGAFAGVAPDAGLIACKSQLYETELTSIYDYLAGLATQGTIIIATNSYGLSADAEPIRPQDPDLIAALEDAIAAGVYFFFSAGNNHQRVGGRPDQCGPNSIWQHKCRSEVMSVATCKLDQTMWDYSSRGPGQYYGNAGMGRKPDVTAPTPENGRVVYGNVVRSLSRGWGTSGACPQAAGLGALLLSKNPTLSTQDLFDVIRSSATAMNEDYSCVGAGLLNCKRAIDSISNEQI